MTEPDLMTEVVGSRFQLGVRRILQNSYRLMGQEWAATEITTPAPAIASRQSPLITQAQAGNQTPQAHTQEPQQSPQSHMGPTGPPAQERGRTTPGLKPLPSYT
jgi:hypothetical protein